MNKIKIIIEDFEDKKYGGNKRFTRFKTDQGWMSCFDKKIIETLKDNTEIAIIVDVDVDEEKGWQTIKKFIKVAEGDEELENSEAKEEKKPSEKPAAASKGFSHTTMYVSYAKDIFCAMFQDTDLSDAKGYMELSIDLVKQARDEFS